MKSSYRFARPAVLVAGLAVLATPMAAGAQRNQGPGPDTPHILVTAFRGDVDGGVKLADELRSRISSEYNARTLYPISKKDIETTLVQSGYRPDSALSPNDIRELAKLVRGDEIIDGTVMKTAAGYKVDARFFLPRDAALSQPLLSVESNDLGDVARKIVREYDSARKQLAANRECENAIRDKKLDVAIAAARRGIAQYPKATLARLCLASAFQAWKTTSDSTKPWADSVLAVTRDITTLDPRSKIAFQLQYDAYKQKGDTDNSLRSLIGLMNSDPTNTALRESVIAELVQSGKAEIAVPTAKQLVTDNPGDPQYARLNWLVLRAAHRFKESVPAGMAYVALDSAASDSNYFFRQVQDLGSDSAYARAAEMAAQGFAKFPKSATLLVLKGQNERKAGQLPAAKASLERALEVDPKVNGATLLLAQIASDLGNADDAIRAVKRDVAMDATNKERDAGLLLSFGNTAYRAANASKKEDDFKRAITYLQASDQINPSVNAKFLIGVSAFSLLQSSGQRLQAGKTCAEAKETADYLTMTNTNMAAGGSVNADAAKQILGATAQYQAFVDGSVKKYCK